ncbi:MAG: pilin [bacterium]
MKKFLYIFILVFLIQSPNLGIKLYAQEVAGTCNIPNVITGESEPATGYTQSECRNKGGSGWQADGSVIKAADNNTLGSCVWHDSGDRQHFIPGGNSLMNKADCDNHNPKGVWTDNGPVGNCVWPSSGSGKTFIPGGNSLMTKTDCDNNKGVWGAPQTTDPLGNCVWHDSGDRQHFIPGGQSFMTHTECDNHNPKGTWSADLTQNTPNPITNTNTPTLNTTYTLLAPLPCNLDANPKIVGCENVNGTGVLKSFDTTQNFGSYLNMMITIFIGICAILAVVMIIVGGIEYMTSELISSKESGKEKVSGAIFGLILALGAYAILFTINPDLLNSTITAKPVSTAPNAAVTTADTKGKCEYFFKAEIESQSGLTKAECTNLINQSTALKDESDKKIFHNWTPTP